MAKIKVLSKEVTIYTQGEQDYICITDIARYKSLDRTDDLIRNWLRNRNTIEFLGIWEHLNNPNFKPVEFDGFRKQAGLNSFTLTPKQWIETDKNGHSCPKYLFVLDSILRFKSLERFSPSQWTVRNPSFYAPGGLSAIK